MARTKRNAMLIEEARNKIQTTQLVNRLTSHALGKLKKPMDASQVTATLGLLKKTIPDIKEIEHSGEVATVTRAIYVDPTAHLDDNDTDSSIH